MSEWKTVVKIKAPANLRDYQVWRILKKNFPESLNKYTRIKVIDIAEPVKHETD